MAKDKYKIEDGSDVAKKFMINKNKELLGEEPETEVEIDDTFLPDKEKPTSAINDCANDNAEAELLLRKIMRTIVTVPVLVGGIVSAAYVFMKIAPHIISFIRRFLGIMMGFN